jgi:hypothetical protein
MPQASEHAEVFNQNTGSYPYGYWALADGPGLTGKGIGIPNVHGLRCSVCPGKTSPVELGSLNPIDDYSSIASKRLGF